MAQAPAGKLVPGNSLITATVEEGRALAITLARHSIQAMQHDEDVLKAGRAQYANDPHWLIAASHVIAVEFATIAAANRYWNTTHSPASPNLARTAPLGSTKKCTLV